MGERNREEIQRSEENERNRGRWRARGWIVGRGKGKEDG